jgi:hypothetical protein
MRRALEILLPALAVACLGACDSPTESDSVEFDVAFTATPDPAVASGPTGVQYKVTNADDTVSYYEYDWRAPFTVNVKDNAGMALDITSINLTVQQATGGIVIPPSGGDQVYYKFNSSAVTNHINANGSADIGFDVWYDLPNQGREALITLSFSFEYEDEDEDVYTYSETFAVKVGP